MVDLVRQFRMIAEGSLVGGTTGTDPTHQLAAIRGPTGPQDAADFWQSASRGSGQITASWKVKGGTWTIVLINATAAAHINAAVSVGAKTNRLLWFGLGFLLVGLIAPAAGAAMLLSSRSPRPTATRTAHTSARE